MALNDKKLTGIASAKQTNPATKQGFWTSVQKWWDDLADPKKVQKVETEEHVLKEARDNMVIAILFAVALLIVRKHLPTLFIAIGFVEALCIWCGALVMREAVRYNQDLKEARKAAERGMGRLLRSTLILIVICTVIALWVSSGAAWADKLPIIKQFSEYQLGMVNELFEFFAEIVGKLG